MVLTTKSITVCFNSNGKRLIFVFNCCAMHEGNGFEAREALFKSWASESKLGPYIPADRNLYATRIDPSQYNRKRKPDTYNSNYDRYLSEKNARRKWGNMIYRAKMFVRMLPPIKHRFQRMYETFVDFFTIEESSYTLKLPKNRREESESDSSTYYRLERWMKGNDTIDS